MAQAEALQADDVQAALGQRAGGRGAVGPEPDDHDVRALHGRAGRDRAPAVRPCARRARDVGDPLQQRIEIAVGRVHVRCRAHDGGEVAPREVPPAVARGDGDELHGALGEGERHVARLGAVDEERHERATRGRRVGEGHARDLRETRAQPGAPRDEVLGDRLDAERLGLGERDAEAEAQCVRRLPGLEAAGGRVQAPRAVGGPGRAAHVGGERLEALEQLAAHVEQRGAARAAQVLAAGRHQQVAADLAHVDGQVPDGLGRVEQVGDAGLAGETPSLRDRLDEPGRRRDVRHRQQGRRAGGQRRAQRLEVQRAVVAVGQQLDDDAPVALEGEQLQRATHVARPRDEHAVAAPEAQRVDGALPADRRALGERDLVRVGAEEPGGERVHGVEARPGGVGRLVAAHARLEVQVLERRRERAGAGQRGAGGVEVVGVADPGSARPLDLDVDQHRCAGGGTSSAGLRSKKPSGSRRRRRGRRA